MTNETPKATKAFYEYCFLGVGRSLAKLALHPEKFGMDSVSVRHLEQWSSKHSWVKRAQEYDTEQIAEQERKQKEAIQQMNERHVMIGTTHQVKAIKQIEALIKIEKFGSQAVVQLLKLAIDVERDARGVNIKKLEVTGKDGGPIEMQRNTDLQNLNDKELEQVEQILLQAKERDK